MASFFFLSIVYLRYPNYKILQYVCVLVTGFYGTIFRLETSVLEQGLRMVLASITNGLCEHRLRIALARYFIGVLFHRRRHYFRWLFPPSSFYSLDISRSTFNQSQALFRASLMSRTNLSTNSQPTLTRNQDNTNPTENDLPPKNTARTNPINPSPLNSVYIPCNGVSELRPSRLSAP